MRKVVSFFFIFCGLLYFVFSQDLNVSSNFNIEQIESINTEDVKWTLKLWGDDISDKIDRRFKIGCKLQGNGDYENAINTFLSVLTLCLENEESLHIDQYDNILLRIAYCYADLGNHKDALLIYSYRIDILRNENNWQEKTPPGLIVIRDISESTIEILLGLCFLDRSITYTNLQNFKEGLEDLAKMDNLLRNKISEEYDYSTKILDGYFNYINNCYILKQYEYVLTAAEKIGTISSEIGKPYSARKIIAIFRYARNSALAFKKYDISKNYSAYIMQIINNTQYSDEYINDDRKFHEFIMKL